MKLSISAVVLAISVLAPALAAPVEAVNNPAIVIREDAAQALPVEQRDSAALASRQLNSGTPGLSAALKAIYAPPFSMEQYGLPQFVTYTHRKLRERYPGHNIFIHHLYKDNAKFRWSVDDPHAEEAQVVKRGVRPEFYKIVVFKGAGTLRKRGDGGPENWVFSGSFDWVGDKVTFRAPRPDAGVPYAKRGDGDAPEPRQLNSGTPGLSAALNDIYAPPFSTELFGLADFVRHTHDRLRDKFPGHNIFIYHRFKSSVKFSWGVTDPRAEEAEIQKPGLSTEFYKVVVFKSAGTLIKQGDGGFENWIFSGWFDRVGDNVNFRAPP